MQLVNGSTNQCRSSNEVSVALLSINNCIKGLEICQKLFYFVLSSMTVLAREFSSGKSQMTTLGGFEPTSLDLSHLAKKLLHGVLTIFSRVENGWRATVPTVGVKTPCETNRMFGSLYTRPWLRQSVSFASFMVFGHGLGQSCRGQRKSSVPAMAG